MVAMILEAIEILVAFTADIAAVGLFLLHADGAGVRGVGLGIHNGKRAVTVFAKLLTGVAVLFGKTS